MLLFAWLVSAVLAQELPAPVSPWTELKQDIIQAQGNADHRQIPLLFVVEGGSKWDGLAVLNAQITKVNTILAKCGVAIGEVAVKTVVWHEGLVNRINNASPYKAPAILELVKGAELPATRPVLFLFGKGLAQTAKAMNRTSVDFYARTFPESEAMLNMIVMTEQYINNTPVPHATATYNTMAHELVHLLGNAGHIPENRNLMSDFETRGSQTGDLNTAQCQAIQGFPY